jgi:hypothetical protein
MPQPHRVRLGDGSVIDLELADVRSWYESGLVTVETQVQAPGSRDWTRLGDAVDVKGWRKPAPPRGVSVPAGPARPRPAARPSAPARAPAAPAAEPGEPAAPLNLGRYARVAAVLVVLFGALYFAAPFVVPLLFGTAEQRRVRSATSPERRFADGGMTLGVPAGWLMLRRDHELFTPPAGTRVALVQPSANAFAALAVETPGRAYVSLDAFLDHVVDDRRRSEPTLHTVKREDAPNGARRLLSTRVTGDTTYDEVLTVWKDGWTYYALAVWAPQWRNRAVPDSEEIRQGFSTQGQMSGRIKQAVDAVTAEVPLLTTRAAEMLMGQSQAQVLEPAEAFRRTYLLAGRGLPALTPAEQQEMGRLSSELYGRLPAGERARLGAYLDRVGAGSGTEAAQDAEMSRLVKSAFVKLAPSRQKRLQELFEKAIATAAASSFAG